MAHTVNVGDGVTVVQSGKPNSSAKVTAIHSGGVIDVLLKDGTVLQSVQHVSTSAPNHWYAHQKTETLSPTQDQPKVVELA